MLFACASILACGDNDAPPPTDSGGGDDAGGTDATPMDTAVADSAPADTGRPDIGRPRDGSLVDTSTSLDGSADAAPPDASDASVMPMPITFVGAGDIAKCSVLGLAGLIDDPVELTAGLVAAYPADTPVFALGDLAYSDGTALEFNTCYNPHWGPFRDRTYPVPGNHDYNTDDGEPYFDYFTGRFGSPRRGWWSRELGAWHVIGLDSNCGDVPGLCYADSEQHRWLRADLAASTATCTVAMWHHPRWSSDRAGDSPAMQVFLQELYDADVDLLLVGHAHNYERFSPQDPMGAVDTTRGIREFVVGSGGADLRGVEVMSANSETFYEGHGILELTLHEDRYDWDFVPTGSGFSDTGTERCH